MTEFKARVRLLGAHFHITLFIRTLPTETWALSGNLVMSGREWLAFQARIKPALIIEVAAPQGA